MKCKLHIKRENKEIDNHTIGESIRVGDYYPIENKDYKVINILLDSNQELPVVYLDWFSNISMLFKLSCSIFALLIKSCRTKW